MEPAHSPGWLKIGKRSGDEDNKEKKKGENKVGDRKKRKVRGGTRKSGRWKREKERKKREQKLKLKHFRHHSLVLKTDPALSSSQKSVQK